MRVLLAEDNAIARTALAGRLRGQGYEVDLAEDGEDALSCVRQAHPDIVIADVLMPRMDGYTLCREIKKDPALKSIPVVFYSATFVTPEDRQLAESVGASRILQKSADLTELGSALREVLEEFAHSVLEVPQQPLKSGEEIDKIYESLFTSKLAAKVNELEADRKALRESEQRYQRLVATIPDVIFVLSLPGLAATYIAPGVERLIGVSSDELVGEAGRWIALLHEEDRARVMDGLKVALAMKRLRAGVFRVQHRDGGFRWIEAHASVVLDDIGQPREMLGVLTDVTEQRKHEETIRNLARFPEENPNPVLRITDDGVLQYANQASEVMKANWDLQLGKPVPNELSHKIRAAQQNNNRFTCTFGERSYSFLIRSVSEAGYVNIYGREVTAELQAQHELVSLNRVLQTLSEGNRTLVHAQSEQSLLENICRVFTLEGNYPLAWVSVPSNEETELDCLTMDGELQESLQQLGWQQVSVAEQAHPMIVAFTNREDVIINRGDDAAKQHRLEGTMGEFDIETIILLPIRYQQKVFGLIGIFSRLPREMQSTELALLDELASDLAYGMQSQRTKLAHEESVLRLNTAMMNTIEAVSIALEKRDPYTAGHQKRVASLSMAIAREMGFSDDRIEGIRLGSMVHDIGKISVPAEILNRPGRLTKDEFGIIKAHPDMGYDILKGVDFPWPIADMIIQHHERMDGSGYPQGLKGDEIVPEARILAVADVVEAITSHRPYRPSLGLDIALDEIERGRGSAYDTSVVDACLSLFREKGFEWEGL